jgi:hypothetical protein
MPKMKEYGKKALGLVLLAGVFSCGGPEAIELVVPVNLSPGAEEIFNAFPNDLTVRTIINYDLLETTSIVSPAGAAPTTFISQNREFLAIWNKARGPGRAFFPSTGFSEASAGSVVAEFVPINRRGFSLILEFLLPFEVEGVQDRQFHVVAYGCVAPSEGPEVKVTREILEAIEDNPITVYAGKSCNRCPPNTGFGDQEGYEIVGGDFAELPDEDLIRPLQICP